MQTFYNELEDEAIAKAKRLTLDEAIARNHADLQQLADKVEINYFLNEPKARNRDEALAAWERIRKELG